MPTKSNNIGGHGGKRAGAGRKKKPVADKAAAGNPGGRPLEVLDIPELEGVEMPKPHDFATVLHWTSNMYMMEPRLAGWQSENPGTG